MQPFTLTLETNYKYLSQLEQIDLLPYGYEIDSDNRFRFDFKLTLSYEHIQEHSCLLKVFRKNSDQIKRVAVYDPDVEGFLIPFKKLVGNWEQPSKYYFLGNVPYSPYNLEAFLQYFRN